TVSYPVDPGDPGTGQNGFPVADGPDPGTDVEITLTEWRPQRRPTSEDECVPPDEPPCTPPPWIDIGGLDYTVSSSEGERAINDAAWCPQDAFGIKFNQGQTRTFKLEAFTPIQAGGSAGIDNAHGFVSFTRQ
ncbi:MAG: hypothetical protein LC808_14645, partial [Actinobacteria bacterium]|nr:hypothetical protein [Actinomycetota bacterium]